MHFFQLISVFLLIQQYQAQVIRDSPTGNCQVDGITDSEWEQQKVFNDVIKDTGVDKVFEAPYKNIKEVGPCGSYFCLELDETAGKFSIVPTKNFSDIDGNGEHQRTNSDKVVIATTIQVYCTSGVRPLTFKITVQDTNNHDPTFSRQTYSYTLPMPMPPKIDITNFGTDIIVQDLDFPNTNITFTFDFEGLIGNVNLLSDYSYQLQLQFSGVRKLKCSEQFTLTATDTGKEPRSRTAEIIFNIDESNSEPPSFTKPSYLFDYDPKTTSIVPRKDQDIRLEGEREGLKCEISEDVYSPFFNDVAVDGQNIELTLKKPFSDDIIAGSIAQITVECYVSKDIGVSSADVIISFPQKPEESVKFSKKKYSATYKIDGNIHDIKMTEPISLTEKVDDVTITVEENLSENLEVKKADDGWTLAVKKNLDKSILKNTEITVVIELSRKSDKSPIDEAFISLLLPNGEDGIYFNEPFFRGDYEYDENNDGTMNPILLTLNNHDVDIVKCGLEKSEYADYFNPTCAGADNLEIKMVKSLPEKLLKAEVVPLSMWVDLKLGNIERIITAAILLNLSYKGKTTPTSSSSTSTTASTTTSGSSSSTTTTTTVAPDSRSSDDCSHTAWIIAVVILLVLLIVYIIATMLFYFKRIRNRNEIDYVPSPSRKTPKYDSRASDDRRLKDVSTRRPTGFIRYNPDQDRSSLDSEYGDTEMEVNNNTNANKFLNDPEETYKEKPENSNGNGRNIGFIIPTPPPEPLTLNDELKRAVEERENRLSQ